MVHYPGLRLGCIAFCNQYMHIFIIYSVYFFVKIISTCSMCELSQGEIPFEALQKRDAGISSSYGKVQVGKDQEKAQSEKDSHSKNRGGKSQTNNQEDFI